MADAVMKSIKISDTADRAIEAYLGWQRGIGEYVPKQEVLEDAVLFFVHSRMPGTLLKAFNIPQPDAKTNKALAK